jgi:hypothetical protein
MSPRADTAGAGNFQVLVMVGIAAMLHAMSAPLVIASVLAAIATFMPVDAAFAEDSMRCGSKLVTRGDGKDKVRALCGEPTSVSLHGFVRRAPRYEYGYGITRYEYFGPGWVDLPVEIWTYNFGSSKLLRKLRFVGDELESIDTDGYGY